jgi:hypothetical protein
VEGAANLASNERDICILGAPSPLYGLYVTYRLILRHILPAILVFVAMVHPETNFSKRVSYLFFGHLSAPCACGEDGSALGMPHECPNMQTAMLKSAADGKKYSSLFFFIVEVVVVVILLRIFDYENSVRAYVQTAMLKSAAFGQMYSYCCYRNGTSQS